MSVKVKKNQSKAVAKKSVSGKLRIIVTLPVLSGDDAEMSLALVTGQLSGDIIAEENGVARALKPEEMKLLGLAGSSLDWGKETEKPKKAPIKKPYSAKKILPGKLVVRENRRKK